MLCLTVLSSGCAADPSPDVESAQTAAVRATATGLLLHNRPWWPVGMNAPQLSTNWSVNIGCGAEVDLDAYFGALPANTLTRFNAFQALAMNKKTGALDFRAMDAVFRTAERHSQLILPVLAPQDGACDDELFKQRQWYIDGWTRAEPIPGRAVLSFRDWVAAAINRWKDVRAVAGWELIGEPEPSNCAGADCTLPARSCPPDAADVLRDFTDSAGAFARSLDPQRLIFAGFTGGGQCGTQGSDYRHVSESPWVDVVEYHDYSDGVGALPGDEWDGLAKRLSQAKKVGKPLLVAEIGELAGSCRSPEDRRTMLDAELTAQRAAGTAGALFWAFVPDPRPTECTLDIGPDDPLWSLVAGKSTLGPAHPPTTR